MGSSLLQFTLEHTTFVARKSTDTCPFESERGADVRFRVHNRADPRVRVCVASGELRFGLRLV